MRVSAKFIPSLVLVGAALALAPAPALGQPAAPPSATSSAKPKADKPADATKAGKPADSAGATPSDKAMADAGAPTGDGGLPAGHHAPEGDMPAGHPPVDDMPPGHPPVADGDGDGDDDEPTANPHGGGAAGRDPRVFNAPRDAAEDDPLLPTGTLMVAIKDAQGRPIPRAPLTLGILRSSVAKGDSSERRAVEADANGNARFDGLTAGSGTTYQITTARGPATYTLGPFALGDHSGKRAILHAYEASPDIDELPVGSQAVVYLTLREDSIQVENLLSVFNLGAVSWLADAVFALPAGFKAFNKQEGMTDARIDEVKDKGAALRGTFSPGRHDFNYRYQVPFEKEETQKISIGLPPHVAQARVIVEASKAMSLEVRGFPEPQQTRREGKRLLVTERPMTLMDRGAQTLEITLSGLPTPGKGRWVALALAVLAIIGGLSYALPKRQDVSLDADVRDDLVDAREALLAEIIALEKAHKSGEVGPKTYARLRAALLDSLARIVSMLDAAKAEEKKRRREARTVESPT